MAGNNAALWFTNQNAGCIILAGHRGVFRSCRASDSRQQQDGLYLGFQCRSIYWLNVNLSDDGYCIESRSKYGKQSHGFFRRSYSPFLPHEDGTARNGSGSHCPTLRLMLPDFPSTIIKPGERSVKPSFKSRDAHERTYTYFGDSSLITGI